jgi:hypothetical protein
MDSLCPACHERELVVIELGVGDHELTLVSCSACASRWWHRDGVEILISDVINLAMAMVEAKGRRNSGRRSASAGVAMS